MAVSSQLLKPVGIGFILLTIAAALTLALIPWGPTINLILPDFVALVLVYWCMNQPRHVGIGWAFCLGLLLDLADGNVFGQHSLAYCFSCWLVMSRHRRLGNLPLWQQALYVFPVLLASQIVMVLVRLCINRVFPGWNYFLGSAFGALLWPLMSQVFQIPQRGERAAEIES